MAVPIKFPAQPLPPGLLADEMKQLSDTEIRRLAGYAVWHIAARCKELNISKQETCKLFPYLADAINEFNRRNIT